MQCTIATEMDPYTHCAAIIISTSDDPQARQLSTIVTNLSLVLDVLNAGDFSIKKITRVASDALRYALLLRFIDFPYSIILRGRAADLATAGFKKSKGNASKQRNEREAGPQDPKDKESHHSTLEEQSRMGKGGPPPLANAAAGGAKSAREVNAHVPAQPPHSAAGNALNAERERLDPDTMTREQFRQVVARQFLLQAIDANPNAEERKTFPFKRFVQFAFKHQLTLEGWLVENCPAFPGDPGFKVDKIQCFQWRKIWDAVFVNKSLRVRRWTAGLLLLLALLIQP